MKYEPEPTQYAGFELATSDDRKRRTLRMEQKIVEACREHCPAVVEGDKAGMAALGILRGKALRDALDALRLAPLPPSTTQAAYKLNAMQSKFAGAVGSTRYFGDGVQPELAYANFRMSSVAAWPPPNAYIVAQSVLADRFKNKRNGLTFDMDAAAPRPSMHLQGTIRKRGDGGDEGHGGQSGVELARGAPMEPELHGDATWSRMNIPTSEELAERDIADLLREVPADCYSMLVTKAGAAILAQTKKINVVVESSMAAEHVATDKLSEIAEVVRDHEHAVGNDTSEPILLTTDNDPNMRVGSGEASATKARHMLRRYLKIQERALKGAIKLRHIPDKENPSDFMTKWVSADKFKKSLEFATHASTAVDATSETLTAHSSAMLYKALVQAIEADESVYVDEGVVKAKASKAAN